MLKNLEGQRVPEVIFKTRQDDNWVDVSSSELFSGRTVVLFSLPGAFTPTCSSSHVPRFNELAGDFRELGVDEVICVSVNDAFVMNEWQKHQDASALTFIPDGSGEFTKGMGLLVNRDDLGFGKRSWRYSMLVRDGVIEKMFIEPQEKGDPFYVSDADTMMQYLDRDGVMSANVVVLTKEGCSHCIRAKSRLKEAGIRFEELVLQDAVSGTALRALSGATTVPQTFVDGQLVGNADALERWLEARDAA